MQSGDFEFTASMAFAPNSSFKPTSLRGAA